MAAETQSGNMLRRLGTPVGFMLQDHSRDKLLNAMAFFAENTKACGKTKLFKLLYFLDFQHFTETGRSVTGLDYYAWPLGPVPRALHDELVMPPNDLAAKFRIENVTLRNGQDMLKLDPMQPFDATHFSKREMRIMQSLAKEFRGHNADQMVEETHLENLPWHQVYVVEGRKQELIPYDLALKRGNKDEVLGAIRDHEEFNEHYSDRRDAPI
jgi:uncharacterized phage-associated protein